MLVDNWGTVEGIQNWNETQACMRSSYLVWTLWKTSDIINKDNNPFVVFVICSTFFEPACYNVVTGTPCALLSLEFDSHNCPPSEYVFILQYKTKRNRDLFENI